MEVIRHAKNRFQVLGSIAVVAGRIVHEPYSRVFTTRKAAERDAAEWIEINAQSLVRLQEEREARMARARHYLAARAIREASYGVQLKLFA